MPGPMLPATYRGRSARREAARDLSRQPGRRPGELFGAFGDLVLGEHEGQGSERVGLNDVDADLEEGLVELPDDVGSGDAEHFVAALERLPAEVVRAQLAKLQVGPGGAVIDDDALACRLEVGLLLAH